MKTSGHRELTPEQVVAWLRSRAGQNWSSRQHAQGLSLHYMDSGVFADVLRDGSPGSFASWPEPHDAFQAIDADVA